LPYLHKGAAEMCCVCIECGEPTVYTGHQKICERCGLTKTIASNEYHLGETKRILGEQRTRLERLDLELGRRASTSKR